MSADNGVIIGSDNGLSPDMRQAIILTKLNYFQPDPAQC